MTKIKQAMIDGDSVELYWYDTETGETEEFQIPKTFPKTITKQFLLDNEFEIEIA